MNKREFAKRLKLLLPETLCARETRLAVALSLAAILFPVAPEARAQGGSLGSGSSPVINVQGRPMAGVSIAICQPMQVTSAQVTGNVATLTTASNPIAVGFAAGMQIMVAGFSGSDTYFNGGTFAEQTGIAGGFTILAVTSTTITYSLTHANASASTTGTVLQMGNSTTPCAGLSTVYSDPANSQTITQPLSSDAFGNWSAFTATTGLYFVQFYGPTVGTSMRRYVPLSPSNINNIIYVDGVTYTGADVFDAANKAAAALFGSQGMVYIPSGVSGLNYSTVTTTLKCLSNVEFKFGNVTATYTGTGNGILVQSVNGCNIAGRLHLLGTRTAGTHCIFVGNPVNNGPLTISNVVQDVICGDFPGATASNGFDSGIYIDGNVGVGTYNNEFYSVSSNGNLNNGLQCNPTGTLRANSNAFFAFSALHNGLDGIQVNGCYDLSFNKVDLENNGQCGIDLLNNITQFTAIGGDSEGNTTADTCFGGPSGTNAANINSVYIAGLNQGSSTPVVGNIGAGPFNHYDPSAGAPPIISSVAGVQLDYGIGVPKGSWTAPPFNLRDTENSNISEFQVYRNSAGAGEVDAGSSHYPLNSGSGISTPLATKSSAYTLTCADSWVNVTGTTTITVPHALTCATQLTTHPRWVVFNSGSNTVTIQADSGNINGGASVTRSANTGYEITCDGTNCFAH